MSAANAAKQIQKVYSEWCVKAAEIILAARIDNPGTADTSLHSASFNLKVPELFNVRSEAVARPEFFQLRTQRSFQVEIYVGPGSEDVGEEAAGQLLERWTFTFLPAAPDPGAQLDRCNQTLVRKQSVALRSLLCFVRLLPAHGICRAAAPPPRPDRSFRFRVEAWPPTSRGQVQELLSQDFVTLQSSVGTLRLSVSQRKDLKSVTASSGPLKTAAAVSSQMDKIEMEEGYFAETGGLASSGSGAVGRLGKIAEEPEARPEEETAALLGEGLRRATAETCGGDGGQSPSTAPSAALHEASSARGEQRPRSRVDSDGSVCSTMSSSSRAPSSDQNAAQAVVLGSTPPLAAGVFGASPGGPCGIGSASSSRPNTPLLTPHTTPKMGPAPDPTVGGLAASSSHPVDATSGRLGASTQPLSGGVIEDLSNIWMSCPPEWGRRRSMSLGAASSRPSSRSLSPEDPSRGASASAELHFSGAARGSAASSTSGMAHHSEGEICMFGMDDEDKSEDEDIMERNVVASAIMEGGDGGAFANLSGQLDAAKLGLGEFDFDGSSQPSSRKASGEENSRKMLSPLIAQLNPFLQPPSLDLPPSAGEPLGPGEEAESLALAQASTSGAAEPAQKAVHVLLEEMGDLVCRLQKRQELAIVQQEASPEELLHRLEHFREVGKRLAEEHPCT